MSMTRAKAAENVRGKLTRLRFLTNRTDENVDAIVKSVDGEFYIDKISSFVEWNVDKRNILFFKI